MALPRADFWHQFVRPMLETEADAVHRYLAIAGQPNAYLEAAEANVAEIQRSYSSSEFVPA